jgi:predicted RecB family nuclease
LKNISKSRFLLGQQCAKQLWWTVHEPDAPDLAADADAVVRGRGVGALAREHVPGGVLIDLPHFEIEARLAATKNALAAGAGVIYEASFAAGGVFASVDILERKRTGFVLIEVKSTLDVKPQHLPDVAVQAHVLRVAGLEVKRVELMHLNRDCRHPDLSNLFARESVTTEIRPLLKAVPEQVGALRRALDGPLPKVDTGAHCSDPYPCRFQGRCWPELPEHHVSTLYRIRAKKAAQFAADGYHRVQDLPETLNVSGPAKRQIQSVREGKTIVEPGLAAALKKLKQPLAFLDFETIMPAVPAWPGCRPYEQVPVQLSCHAFVEGKLEHRAWLADSSADPRQPFADALLSACEGAETILAYNASFELQRIDQLISLFPKLAPGLKRLKKRIVDLLLIVRDHVYHPGFHGSFSLKSVLPALVPGLGYDDLEIKGGSSAAALLEALLLHAETMTPREKLQLRTNLLAYCERDTLAMVRLYELLQQLARVGSSAT